MLNLLTSSLSDSTLKQPVKCTATLRWETVVVLRTQLSSTAWMTREFYSFSFDDILNPLDFVRNNDRFGFSSLKNDFGF